MALQEDNNTAVSIPIDSGYSSLCFILLFNRSYNVEYDLLNSYLLFILYGDYVKQTEISIVLQQLKRLSHKLSRFLTIESGI